MKPRFLLLILASGLVILPGRADLLIDGDFSTSPGSGSPAPSTAEGAGTYQYVVSPTGGGGAGTTSTNIGGTGGWTATDGSGAGLSAVNLEDTLTSTGLSWVPTASAANTNGYVIQLDTVAHTADAGNPATTGFTTGDAISQTVTVTAGQLYSLTFSINTEAGAAKAATAYADVMITNATIVSPGGNSGTVLTSNATNLNALTYGDVTGLQYTVTTTAAGGGGTATTWDTYTLTFTANSTGSSELTFADDTLDNVANSNIALEDIDLVAAVPEPREGALLVLLGLGVLVIVRKLRARLSGPALTT